MAPSSALAQSNAGARSASPYEAKKFDFSHVKGLSDRALELHRTLYEGYVKETNALLPLVSGKEQREGSDVAKRLSDDGLVRRFAFEYNGMILHELFFDALRGKSALPSESSAFMKAIQTSFGGFDAWQNDIRRLAQTRGVGWVITTQSARDKRLINVWIDEHSHGLLADWQPVLALDLWEHAFLLDFKPSERSQYLTTLFDNIDWKVVASRCS